VAKTAGPVPSACAGPPPILATGAIGPVLVCVAAGACAATVTWRCFAASLLAGAGAAKADHTGVGPGDPAGQELGDGLGAGLGVCGGWLLCVRLGLGLGLEGGDEDCDGDGLGFGEVGDGVGLGEVGEGVGVGVGDVGDGVGVGDVGEGVGLALDDVGSGVGEADVGEADVGLGLGVGVTDVAARAAGANATVPATIRPGTKIRRTRGVRRRMPPAVGRPNLALEMMAFIMTFAPSRLHLR
jgi:hypothetical protein